ncbi:tripartite tricarboxylate transporter substrate binding protein [Allopusillimonas soli]|uniref:Tripartite tricarboxylate transporter substrate binding protein n=1 Tax=Allopusillimonas soli TaxID=659016 RepID=A0A853FAA7_9BURK|nr:tripartite tricarboxylate transporter substrate binding protein [Allopusillimonas soli]NYT35860.1 tripartite tricarboxylate transporter substrate binding protein [Allopusillimonas soli]TEA76226.1 tripartite tricarboxylate transporter substrate binding protein [Allopusillimonas soli]
MYLHQRLLVAAGRGLLGLALLSGAAIAAAQNAYPTHPITMIVPFGPGSTTDTLARVVADGLSQRLGQSVVVQNKPGASGNIGAAEAARAKPDGYTLLVGPTSTNAVNASLFKNLSYDPLKDFQPITDIAKSANVLVVHPDVPAKNVSELEALVKEKELSYASTGNGGSMHLSGELFKSMTGGKMLHVPYKGGGDALGDLLPGRVQMMFCNIPLCLPHIKSGKLRALAVTTSTRSQLLPDVPTMAESGLDGYDVSGWFGLFAPAGTDEAIVQRLNKEVLAILDTPQVREKLLTLGAEPDGSSSDQFEAFVQSEYEKWAKVIKEAGISVE